MEVSENFSKLSTESSTSLQPPSVAGGAPGFYREPEGGPLSRTGVVQHPRGIGTQNQTIYGVLVCIGSCEDMRSGGYTYTMLYCHRPCQLARYARSHERAEGVIFDEPWGPCTHAHGHPITNHRSGFGKKGSPDTRLIVRVWFSIKIYIRRKCS